MNTPAASPMSLDDLRIPAPMISDQLLAELTDAVGADNAATSGMPTAAVIGHAPGSTSQIGKESAKTSGKNRNGDRIRKT